LRPTLYHLIVALLLAAAAQAQDVRYISDKQYIPLRSGAGGDYRIIHRGLPSGTRLTVARTSADGEWAEITTDGGTTGWIRSQYLMADMPAQNKLEAAQRQATDAAARSAALTAEVDVLKTERDELLARIQDGDAQLGGVSEELAQLKQISGNAVQLDIDNRRLVEESENLRSEVEMLEAENQRLQDKLDSEDFINGALAVLLGVIITLVVPRLWPKRRKSSSWA
jgi:SH3 domain protein